VDLPNARAAVILQHRREEHVQDVTDAGAHYAKVGLYANAVSPEMIEALREACAGGVRVIAVCFAEAPPGADDIARLAESGVAGLMLDTAEKAGPSLGGLMSAVALAAFVASVKAHGLLCGLAGKLALADVMPLRALGADYLGFRSALCAAQARTAAVEQTAVRALMQEFNRELAPVTSPLATAV
jgi:dihydroneopterin aldolase